MIQTLLDSCNLGLSYFFVLSNCGIHFQTQVLFIQPLKPLAIQILFTLVAKTGHAFSGCKIQDKNFFQKNLETKDNIQVGKALKKVNDLYLGFSTGFVQTNNTNMGSTETSLDFLN